MRLILNSHPKIHCFDEWKSYKALETEEYENPQELGLLGFKIPNWTDLLVDSEDYRKLYKRDRVIFMMRDVRAVVASMLHLPTGIGTWFQGALKNMDEKWPNDPSKQIFFDTYEKELKKSEKHPLKDFCKMALFWKYKTSKYLDMVKLGWPVLPIRYESLVRFPRSHINLVMQFLESEWDDNLLKHYELEHDETFDGIGVGNVLVKRPIDTESIDKWKTILTPEQERVLLQVSGLWNNFASPLAFPGK